MQRRLFDWVLLVALALIWGTSFAANKIAVAAYPPVVVVWGRLALGTGSLAVAAALAGLEFPRGRRLWAHLLLLALVGNALPFFLITWGQERIDSGLAGVLMAVMPLATMVMAHFLVAGERVSRRALFGFLLGFAGILLLVGPDVLGRLGGRPTAFLAQAAVLGGALCYAANTVLARHLPPLHVIVSGATTLALATLVMTPPALSALAGGPSTGATALASVAWLGLVSTGLATVLYFQIVSTCGPTFLSLINYLIPVIAVAVGAAALGESFGAGTFVALGLILGGIAISQSSRPVPDPH
jgi:drug/metabolite transporter (DMT)-like permease